MTAAPAPSTRPIAVSVADAARLVGISETTYRRLALAGLVPHVRMGSRRVVVPVAALEEWMAAEAKAHMWVGGPR